MRILFLVCLPALLAVTGCDSPPEDRAVQVDSEDVEMNQAMEQARSTLDQFLDKRERLGKDFGGLLKVYISGESEEDGEHMWVQLAPGSRAEPFRGVLLSAPIEIEGIDAGQVVEFGKEDVSDWLYTEDGKARGAFTVQLLRSRMSAEERAEHDSHYPFSFD